MLVCAECLSAAWCSHLPPRRTQQCSVNMAPSEDVSAGFFSVFAHNMHPRYAYLLRCPMAAHDVKQAYPAHIMTSPDIQACAKELLQPGGEIAAVAGRFDVIAFSTAPISWGACYEGHLQLLEGASKPLLGRQNGRRPFRPNSASTGCTRVQVCHYALWSHSTFDQLHFHVV